MDSRGTRNGSAAAIVTRVVTTIKTKGITFTSSYEEEAAVMESALSWTFTNANHQSIILLICIDSESLCEAFISSHSWTFSVHNSIISISSSIFIQWILVYYAIPGNDIANKAAKKTTSIATNRILPTSLSSSIQVINDTISDTPPTHERVDSIYQRLRVSRDVKHINNRKDDVLLARLQSDHHSSLKQYLHRPDPSKDPICLNCRV